MDLELAAMETPDSLPDAIFSIQAPDDVELKDNTEYMIGLLDAVLLGYPDQ